MRGLTDRADANNPCCELAIKLRLALGEAERYLLVFQDGSSCTELAQRARRQLIPGRSLAETVQLRADVAHDTEAA